MTEHPTDRDDLQIGTMIAELSAPSLPRVLNRIGFGFAIVDAEHGTFTFESLGALAAVSSGLPLSLFVRVPGVSREHIGRVLDLGADGIVVPMVETVQQAQDAVRCAMYPPLGERGVSLTRAHSGYGVDDVAAYCEEANVRLKVYVQIESRAGLDAAADIASLAGVDGLLLGPNDFLQSIGRPGRLEDPELDSAMERLAQAAQDAGVEHGVISASADLLSRGAALGMTVLSLDSELGHLIKGATRALGDLRDVLDAGGRPGAVP